MAIKVLLRIYWLRLLWWLHHRHEPMVFVLIPGKLRRHQ